MKVTTTKSIVLNASKLSEPQKEVLEGLEPDYYSDTGNIYSYDNLYNNEDDYIAEGEAIRAGIIKEFLVLMQQHEASQLIIIK